MVILLLCIILLLGGIGAILMLIYDVIKEMARQVFLIENAVYREERRRIAKR